VAYAGDSDYASNFVLRTETQNYGLNHNDGTAEFNTYIDPSFFGVGVMFGSTTNHGVGIYTNDYNRIWIDGGDNITGGNVQIGNNAPTFTYKLEVSGTVSTTGFRMTNGASDGYILQSDSNGVASWTSPPTQTIKVSDIRNYTASVAETISHTLNTEDLIIQTYDSNPDSLTFGVQIIPDTIQITGTSSVDITLSQTLSSVKTIIIG
jgi:hypothetical protein